MECENVWGCAVFGVNEVRVLEACVPYTYPTAIFRPVIVFCFIVVDEGCGDGGD